jgi:hypothetical protein
MREKNIYFVLFPLPGVEISVYNYFIYLLIAVHGTRKKLKTEYRALKQE